MDSAKSTGVNNCQQVVVTSSGHQILTDQQQQDVALALQLCPSSSSGYAISTGQHQIHYQQMAGGAHTAQQPQTIQLQLPASSTSGPQTVMLQLSNGQTIPAQGQTQALSFVVPPTAALVQGQGTGAFFIPFPGQQGNALTVQQQILHPGQQMQQMQPQQQVQMHPTPAPSTSTKRKKSSQSTGGGLNAYAVFTKDVRHRLVEQHPDATFSDLAKITGVEWRSLSEEQKGSFREKARRMQEEAQAQLQRQKQSQHVQHIQPQPHLQMSGGGGQSTLFDTNSQFDASSIDFSSFLSNPAVVNSRPDHGVKQEPNSQHIQHSQVMSSHGGMAVNSPTSPSLIKPGARNGFILFSKELRPKLKSDFPSASFGELSKLTGVEWKKLNDHQKREWEERAFKMAEEKQQHQRKPMVNQMQAGPSQHEATLVQVPPISSDAKVLDILGQAAQLLGLAGPLTQQHHPQQQVHHQPQQMQQQQQEDQKNVHVQDPKQSPQWGQQHTQVMQQQPVTAHHHQYAQHEPHQTSLWPEETQAPQLASPQKKPAKKRAPRKRNPPTGTGSGYVLYAKEIRSKVKEQHPEATFGEIGKYTGAEWNKISHEEKVEWGIKMDQLLESKGKKPMRARAVQQVHPPEPKPSNPDPGSMNQRMFHMETGHGHI